MTNISYLTRLLENAVLRDNISKIAPGLVEEYIDTWRNISEDLIKLIGITELSKEYK